MPENLSRPKQHPLQESLPRNERGDYGQHKVRPPLFYQVECHAPIDVIARRLRSFGRVFHKQGEVIQVAHILRKRGVFYVCHFKSLLYIDNVLQRSDIAARDLAETSAALDLLVREGLVSLLPGDTTYRSNAFGPCPQHVKSVSPDDFTWTRIAKYTFKKPH